jgi:hypothetical protein
MYNVVVSYFQVIPACPTNTLRCCSRDRMFTALTQIMAIFGPQQLPATPPTAAPPPSGAAIVPPPGSDRVSAASVRQGKRKGGRLFAEAIDDEFFGVFDEEESRQQHSGDHSTTTAAPWAPAGAAAATSPTAGANAATNGATAATNGATAGGTAAGVAPLGTSSIPGLTCVPLASCPVSSIYGTRAEHFALFGFLSTAVANCDTAAGQILCATAGTPTAATTAAPTTAAGTELLPCRPVSECAVVFGTQADHFTRYPEQASCPSGQVRCVTAAPAAATTPATPLFPAPTAATTTYAPVTAAAPTTPVPIFTAAPPGGATGGLPVGPVAPSVSIIGPQPIYVSYNNVIGPTVGGCSPCAGTAGNGAGAGSPGTVSSVGVGAGQEQQINTLLQHLRSRLQSIITSARA